MPQAALDAIGQPDLDIVLGDLHGQACAPWITEVAEAALIAQGFRVQRNIPFAGAYNMQQYGRPRMGRHALQIEIARRLYMDEGSYDMTAGFAAVRARLAQALADIRAHAVTRLGLS
jgi:N-formylglutamate deformylase